MSWSSRPSRHTASPTCSVLLIQVPQLSPALLRRGAPCTQQALVSERLLIEGVSATTVGAVLCSSPTVRGWRSWVGARRSRALWRTT